MPIKGRISSEAMKASASIGIDAALRDRFFIHAHSSPPDRIFILVGAGVSVDYGDVGISAFPDPVALV
jgi:hypothetical protein